MKKLFILLMILPFFSHSQFVHVSEEEGLLGGNVRHFIEGADGSLWVGSGNGLTRILSGEFENFTSENGLLSNSVNAIAVDLDGNIWVGSYSGLSVFDGNSWSYPSFSTSSSANNIKDIEIASNGDVWVATSTGIAVYSGNNVEVLTIAHGLPTNNIKQLAKASDGTMWIGTSSGLCHYYNGEFVVYTTEDGLSSNNVPALVAGNQVYIYASHTLTVYNGAVFTQYSNLSTISNTAPIKSMVVDDNQDLWLAFETDIVKLHNLEVDFTLRANNTNINSNLSLSLKGFGIIGDKLYIGQIDSYWYTFESLLIPENILPNTDTLNINNRTFWGHVLGLSDYTSNSHVSNINMFLAGMDEENQLHMSGGGFERDWTYGPFSEDFNTFNHVVDWFRTWKVNKTEIEDHKLQWTNGSYDMPYAIEHWPDIADYLDSNSNGIYDPENGDYPLIRGDQALLNVYNDNYANEIGRNKMNVEVHALSYAYASEDSALNNTVFTNYKIINKSTHSYSSVYLGLFHDVDLGGSQDDYLGCDTALNAFYTYNAADEDDYFESGSIPADGTVFLNTKMTSFVYNEGNVISTTSIPFHPLEYYNYLLGYWKDGSAITYGGNGYGGDSAVKYVFTGDPLMNAGWTENSAGNEPGDRKALGVVGPFNLEPDQEICIDVAFVRGTAWASTNLMSVKELKNRISHIHPWYANQEYICDSIITIPETELAVNALDQTICASPSPGLVQLPTVMYGGEYPFAYEWSNEFGNYNSEALSPHLWSPEITTDYYVTVTDNTGLTVTDTLTVTVNPGPLFDLGNDTTLLDIQNLELNPGLGSSVDYLWSTGSELSNYFFYGYSGVGEYDIWLHATDAQGCFSVDSITITVEFFTSVKAVDDYMVKVYPNPSSEIINVDLPQKSDYILFNVVGKPIQKGVFDASSNLLEIHGLSQGTYFLYIEALNIRKKLIIQ